MSAPVRTTAWSVDTAHSAVNFRVRNYFLNVRGRLAVAGARVLFDEAAPERSSVSVVLHVGTLSTGHPGRDAHVLSAEMLDVARFPAITFESTSIELETPVSGRMTGDLTVRDVTRRVDLDVQLLGRGLHPTVGAEVIDVVATTSVSRRDFGVTFNIPWGGRNLIGDRVDIEIELQAVRQP